MKPAQIIVSELFFVSELLFNEFRSVELAYRGIQWSVTDSFAFHHLQKFGCKSGRS